MFWTSKTPSLYTYVSDPQNPQYFYFYKNTYFHSKNYGFYSFKKLDELLDIFYADLFINGF